MASRDQETRVAPPSGATSAAGSSDGQAAAASSWTSSIPGLGFLSSVVSTVGRVAVTIASPVLGGEFSAIGSRDRSSSSPSATASVAAAPSSSTTGTGAAVPGAPGGGDNSRHTHSTEYERRGKSDAQAVLREINAYGFSPVPAFYQGSYLQAIHAARSSGRPLLIYIHCGEHEDSEQFAKDTLCTETLCNFVGENLVAWAGSIRHGEAYKLCHSLQVATFPALALLAPSSSATSHRSNQVAILFRHTGCISVEDLVTQLLLVNEARLAAISHQQARQSQDATNRMLRERQDQEYKEALAIDAARRESEEIARRERVLAEQKANAEIERANAIALAEQAKNEQIKTERIARREALMQSLPPEPPVDASHVTTIAIRLPNGKKLSRRFTSDSCMGIVFDFIDSHELVDHDGDLVSSYRLLSNFPRRVHGDRSVTIAELALGSRIIFVAEPVDESDGEGSDGEHEAKIR